jgi:hypothetical protein
MARDSEARAALNPRRRIFEDAPRHLRNATAGFAADVLVMVVPHLVVSLAVAQVDPADGTFTLHG